MPTKHRKATRTSPCVSTSHTIFHWRRVLKVAIMTQTINMLERWTNARLSMCEKTEEKTQELWKFYKNTCGVGKATSGIFLAAEVAIQGWPSSSSFQVWLFNFLTMCYPQWSWDQFLDQFILSMKGSGGGIHTVGGIEKRCPKILTVASL